MTNKIEKRKGLKGVVIIVEDIVSDYVCNTNNLNKTRLTNGEFKIYYEGAEHAAKYWENQKNKYEKNELPNISELSMTMKKNSPTQTHVIRYYCDKNDDIDAIANNLLIGIPDCIKTIYYKTNGSDKFENRFYNPNYPKKIKTTKKGKRKRRRKRKNTVIIEKKNTSDKEIKQDAMNNLLNNTISINNEIINNTKTTNNTETEIDKLIKILVADNIEINESADVTIKDNKKDDIKVINKVKINKPTNIQKDNIEPKNKKKIKNNNLIQKEDSLGVYLVAIKNILKRNDIAPKSYVMPLIRQMILHKRKLELTKKIEQTLVNDAINKKQFEQY